MKKIILSLTALFSITVSNAQLKEGSITYEMKVENLPEEQAAMMSGMETKVYYKSEKTRVEVSSAMYNMIVVTDEKGNATQLTEMMGQKYFMKIKAEDMKKEEKTPDPKITYKDDKKTIAGYECKKAVVEITTEKGEKVTTDVWYTEKLPYSDKGSKKGSGAFKGLKGAPLEYSMNQGGMTMHFMATAVSTSPVPDSKFVVSTEGYTEMTPEMMKQMGGGK